MPQPNHNGRWIAGLVLSFFITFASLAFAVIATTAATRAQNDLRRLETVEIQSTENRLKIVGVEKDVGYIRERVDEIYQWLKEERQ